MDLWSDKADRVRVVKVVLLTSVLLIELDPIHTKIHIKKICEQKARTVYAQKIHTFNVFRQLGVQIRVI